MEGKGQLEGGGRGSQAGKATATRASTTPSAVLSGRVCAQVKSGDGPVQIARMDKLAKGSALKARTQAINQLKAVLVSTDPNLREELAALNNAELLHACARLGGEGEHDEDGEVAVLQATRITLYLLAQRIGQLTEQIQGLEGRLARLRGTPRPAAAHRGGHWSGHSRHFVDHCGGQPGTPRQ
ncbi:hypothetical protein OK006_3089 [Actinobacteria bacterium OK006]|nr:hypothetical protein OK006_3089 [Actinobacteria bacterium OK006]